MDAITAVSGEELESRGAQDISALGAIAPNLAVYPGRSFNGSITAYIRGIGQFDSIWGVAICFILIPASSYLVMKLWTFAYSAAD